MNSWFTVKVKYTKQMDDGTFKRVSEPYLLASMTFTDAEARIYNELGELIRGEFLVTGITRTDVHDIFHYDDSDVWFNCKIKFESGDGGEEGSKAKKVTQAFLVTAHSVEEAYQRLQESLGGMLIDFQITKIILSPIVEIFPFEDNSSEADGFIIYSAQQPQEGTYCDVMADGELHLSFEYEGDGRFLAQNNDDSIDVDNFKTFTWRVSK